MDFLSDFLLQEVKNLSNFFFHSKSQTTSQLLADAIDRTKLEIDTAYRNFEHALEPDLIDCYIYQLQAAQMRYKFLLNCARREATPHPQR